MRRAPSCSRETTGWRRVATPTLPTGTFWKSSTAVETYCPSPSGRRTSGTESGVLCAASLTEALVSSVIRPAGSYVRISRRRTEPRIDTEVSSCRRRPVASTWSRRCHSSMSSSVRLASSAGATAPQ